MASQGDIECKYGPIYNKKIECAHGSSKVKKVIQFHGGSDSGGIYWQSLNILKIHQTPDGLILEVE